MRRLIALMLAVLFSSSTLAATKEDWLKLTKSANDLLFDCYKKQMFHAAESEADELAFALLIASLCRKQQQVLVNATYNLLIASGRTEAQAQKIARETLESMNTSILALYSAYRDDAKSR